MHCLQNSLFMLKFWVAVSNTQDMSPGKKPEALCAKFLGLAPVWRQAAAAPKPVSEASEVLPGHWPCQAQEPWQVGELLPQPWGEAAPLQGSLAMKTLVPD